MPNRSSPEEKRARETLRSRGLRATPARLRVMAALTSSRVPMTALELSELLHESEMDRVTVYRTLSTLVEVGLAHRMDPGDRVFRFAIPKTVHSDLAQTTSGDAAGSESNGHAHPHRVCDSCGTVECMEDAEVVVHRRGDATTASDAFSVKQQDVILHGTCGECAVEGDTPAASKPTARGKRTLKKTANRR